MSFLVSTGKRVFQTRITRTTGVTQMLPLNCESPEKLQSTWRQCYQNNINTKDNSKKTIYTKVIFLSRSHFSPSKTSNIMLSVLPKPTTSVTPKRTGVINPGYKLGFVWDPIYLITVFQKGHILHPTLKSYLSERQNQSQNHVVSWHKCQMMNCFFTLVGWNNALVISVLLCTKGK